VDLPLKASAYTVQLLAAPKVGPRTNDADVGAAENSRFLDRAATLIGICLITCLSVGESEGTELNAQSLRYSVRPR
jgi:hypothetical protein